MINSCDGKAEFSVFFQFLVSHDPSEIILICWYAAQETFIFLPQIIWYRNHMYLIIYVLLLDTFYASLLNKSINLLKHFYWLQPFEQ